MKLNMETLKICNRDKYFLYNASQWNFGSQEICCKIYRLGCWKEKQTNKKYTAFSVAQCSD